MNFNKNLIGYVFLQNSTEALLLHFLKEAKWCFEKAGTLKN